MPVPVTGRTIWPFSDERIAWSIIAVVDPWVVVVGSVTGFAIATRNAGLSAVAVAVVYYLVAGAMQQERAADAVRILAAERGHEVERIVVKPTLGNLLLWRGLYQSSETAGHPARMCPPSALDCSVERFCTPVGMLLFADAIAPAGSVHAHALTA